ncbi:MAG: helix-turn-helix transcriptional regulator, partial [Muribaculaceae bacterium]|nr:helix-turn-helix transcriptional regulator [Muribaculaceae bacterium]
CIISIFIISPKLFVEALDFFLPRKVRTLIIGDVKCHANCKNGLATVSVSSDESDIVAIISRFLKDIKGNEQPGELSSREIEVLRFIAQGKINKEIADILCISVNTVITHRKNISSKLGIKSASGLSLYAMMNGIIP